MKKTTWFVALLILLGSVSWSLTMVKSGLPTRWGLGFWGANGHDGIWHLALIESLKNGFPIQNPLFSGTVITNYHWGFDFIIAIFSKITGLSPSTLYFQVSPPVLAFLVGLSTFLFIRHWTNSNKAVLWALFFTYFGGSFGWLVTLVRDKEISGESLFWAQQGVSTLINPPLALSLVFLTFGFWLITCNPEPKPKKLIWQILIFSPLFLIKSYASVIALAGLFALGVYGYLKTRSLVGLSRFASVLVVTIIVILVTSPASGGLIQFEPLWFVHSMIEAGDRLYLPKLVLARQAYSAYQMYHRLVPIELFLIFIFFIGNLGMRIVSLFWVKDFIQKIKNAPGIDWAVAAMTFSALVLPLLVTQKGTTWNTIQFFYYGQIFSGWLAAIWLSKIKLPQIPKTVLSLTIITLTLPTTLSTLVQNYIPSRPPASLPKDEQKALEFLKAQPYGVVLSYPYDKPPTSVQPPIPLYLYDTTAYVSAFSGKPSYLADTVNLSILNYPWSSRQSASQKFFTENSSLPATKFLRDNNISYIYLVGHQRLPLHIEELNLDRLYQQNDVQIYRTKN